MPDGTSRQGVGNVAAVSVKIGGKIRSLKCVQLSEGNRKNWANAVIYMLKRLAVASGTEIEDIWHRVSVILSDLCKVNKQLAKEIQGIIGSEWKPGQVFCNLHFTLAIAEGIKTTISAYQIKIGPEKLFPMTVGFQFDLENKIVVIQILDCWMRLTSVRWHAKPWNKYKSFTDFAEQRGLKNVGHMLHANRFGEFEERCAGGLYLADAWVEWLKCQPAVRNQLACYLRETFCLIDQCKFLWAGSALIGLHITAPYMSMLLEHKTTPRKLLIVLPSLYKNLKEYPETLCQLNKCGIPALQPYFLDPFNKKTSPYGVEVLKALSEYVDSCDKPLMNAHLKNVCLLLADTLQRQRGNQYGFGDNPESEELVTKNLTEELLDDEDISTTKPIENFFGNLDRELKKVGSRGFNKAADDLIIKTSKDLVSTGEFEWKSKANRKKATKLKELQGNFNNSQKKIEKTRSEKEKEASVNHHNKILSCIALCKAKHDGPLTTKKDLKKFIQKFEKEEKAFSTSLNLEIRLRKLTMDKVHPTYPLFRVKNLTNKEKIQNLENLISSELDFKTMAEMEDLENAIKDKQAQNLIIEKTETSTSFNDQENTFSVGEFVIGLFTDGFYPGEVVRLDENSVTVDFLQKTVLKQDKENLSLWKNPSECHPDRHTLEFDSILPIRPVLSITKFSNSRLVIYELKNSDIVEKFI